ncbi:MAG: hypothetical protein MUE41_17125 [Gemmatimonadaceae bacterium]|nr:hypothetical protein [Gemmatimonadaceae bacterium]
MSDTDSSSSSAIGAATPPVTALDGTDAVAADVVDAAVDGAAPPAEPNGAVLRDRTGSCEAAGDVHRTSRTATATEPARRRTKQKAWMVWGWNFDIGPFV